MKLKIYVQPGARKTEIVGEHDGAMKIKIKAPPVDGKANEEVVRFFAELLGIAKNKIELVQGEKSRHKTIEIPDECAQLLAVHKFPIG